MSLSVMAQQCTLPSWWLEPIVSDAKPRDSTPQALIFQRDVLHVIANAAAPMSYPEICEKTGLTYERVKYACGALAQKSRIKRPENAKRRPALWEAA